MKQTIGALGSTRPELGFGGDRVLSPLRHCELKLLLENNDMAKKKTKKNKPRRGTATGDIATSSKTAKDANGHASLEGSVTLKATAEEGTTRAKMTNKEFERELQHLHVELVKLQDWVKATNAKICVLFEGRDAAGKGGIIKRITERVSPRVFRVVALPAPTEREKSQMYIQRYIGHLPAGGEVVLFDRSWYNRAGVERVMGFATETQVSDFFHYVVDVERAMINSGIILIKYWLEVSQEEQTRRFEARMTDGRKTWKLSPMDLEAHRRWYDYSRARDDMLQHTDSVDSPWHIVDTNEKRRGRLNCIAHFLSIVPYEEMPRPKITLPKLQPAEGYVAPDYPYRYIPEHY
jgi:polyphosphate kinase